MENVVPLFRLPYSVQQRVLRIMVWNDQLAFSIVSSKSRRLFKSLKAKIQRADLSIGYVVRLIVHFHDSSVFNIRIYYKERPSFERIPDLVVFHFHGLGRYASGANWLSHLSLRDLLLHLIDIYYNFEISDLEFSNQSLLFDIDSVKTALRGIQTPKITIRQMTDEELFKLVTKLFLPAKRLKIYHHYQPADMDHFRRVLLQNFDHFRAYVHLSPYYHSLGNLLSMNATSIDYLCTTMTDKTINRFLKLWIKGAMPRLKRLFMRFSLNNMVWKKDNIMKRINYTELAEDHERMVEFEFCYGPKKETLQGGLSIVRCDGVEANIQLTEHEGTDNLMNFSFFVLDY